MGDERASEAVRHEHHRLALFLQNLLQALDPAAARRVFPVFLLDANKPLLRFPECLPVRRP
jgi:hypothetical protein